MFMHGGLLSLSIYIQCKILCKYSLYLQCSSNNTLGRAAEGENEQTADKMKLLSAPRSLDAAKYYSKQRIMVK